MIDMLMAIVGEFFLTGFLALSPTRIWRKARYGIPLNTPPEGKWAAIGWGCVDTVLLMAFLLGIYTLFNL